MFSRIQPSSPWDQGLVWCKREGEEDRDRETDTQEERKETRERERDAGKQIEGHVQGSRGEEV